MEKADNLSTLLLEKLSHFTKGTCEPSHFTKGARGPSHFTVCVGPDSPDPDNLPSCESQESLLNFFGWWNWRLNRCNWESDSGAFPTCSKTPPHAQYEIRFNGP